MAFYISELSCNRCGTVMSTYECFMMIQLAGYSYYLFIILYNRWDCAYWDKLQTHKNFHETTLPGMSCILHSDMAASRYPIAQLVLVESCRLIPWIVDIWPEAWTPKKPAWPLACPCLMMTGINSCSGNLTLSMPTCSFVSAWWDAYRYHINPTNQSLSRGADYHS